MKDNMFIYSPPATPEDCEYVISPSQLNLFFKMPKTWYEENMLNAKRKSNKLYKGDDGRVLGTILHYIYEMTLLNKEVEYSHIEDDLNEYALANTQLDLDKSLILSLYPMMSEITLNEFIYPLIEDSSTSSIECEIPLTLDLGDGIYIRGTTDLLLNKEDVVDYKNVSKKPSNLEDIPYDHMLQLMSYAYTLKRLYGYDIKYLTIIYTVRPTKTIPPRTYKVRHKITADDWFYIENTIQLVKDTILFIKKHPELDYIVFKAYSLKLDRAKAVKFTLP